MCLCSGWFPLLFSQLGLSTLPSINVDVHLHPSPSCLHKNPSLHLAFHPLSVCVCAGLRPNRLDNRRRACEKLWWHERERQKMQPFFPVITDRIRCTFWREPICNHIGHRWQDTVPRTWFPQIENCLGRLVLKPPFCKVYLSMYIYIYVYIYRWVSFSCCLFLELAWHYQLWAQPPTPEGMGGKGKGKKGGGLLACRLFQWATGFNSWYPVPRLLLEHFSWVSPDVRWRWDRTTTAPMDEERGQERPGRGGSKIKMARNTNVDGGFKVVRLWGVHCHVWLLELSDKSNDVLLFVPSFPADADCWQVEGKVVVAKEVVVVAAWGWPWECPAWAWECLEWVWGWECLEWVWAWACLEACLQEAAVCGESVMRIWTCSANLTCCLS